MKRSSLIFASILAIVSAIALPAIGWLDVAIASTGLTVAYIVRDRLVEGFMAFARRTSDLSLTHRTAIESAIRNALRPRSVVDTPTMTPTWRMCPSI
jgi:hypothetical protein